MNDWRRKSTNILSIQARQFRPGLPQDGSPESEQVNVIRVVGQGTSHLIFGRNFNEISKLYNSDLDVCYALLYTALI